MNKEVYKTKLQNILDFAHDSTDILCNSEHPEDGRLRPKEVGA